VSEEIVGEELSWSYKDVNRIGDHIWWIGDNGRFQSHYPNWTLECDVRGILEEIWDVNRERWRPPSGRRGKRATRKCGRRSPRTT
jgi:CDP-paratose 2-epimerase